MTGRVEAAFVCPGPLVWLDASDDDGFECAIVECASCEYWVVTGHFLDLAHSLTPLERV